MFETQTVDCCWCSVQTTIPYTISHLISFFFEKRDPPILDVKLSLSYAPHSNTLYPSLCHTHTSAFLHTHIHAYRHIYKHPHTVSLSLSLSLPNTHTHTHSLSLSLSLSLFPTHMHTRSLTYTPSRSRTTVSSTPQNTLFHTRTHRVACMCARRPSMSKAMVLVALHRRNLAKFFLLFSAHGRALRVFASE